MNSWWYAENSQPIGPYDVVGLQQLFAAGTIGPQTQLWREGMAGWGALSSLPELAGALMPPSLPPVAAAVAGMPPILNPAPAYTHANPATTPQQGSAQKNNPGQSSYQHAPAGNEYLDAEPSAGIFLRFLARTLDCALAALLVLLVLAVIGVVLGVISGAAHVALPAPGVGIVAVAGMLFLPAVLLVDSFIYGIFGNTAGKALLGIRVLTEVGERPEFSVYLGRNLHMWLLAFGLGLPIVNLLTMIFQAVTAAGGNPASYDASAARQVVKRPTGILARLVFSFLFCAIVTIPIGFSIYQGFARHRATRQMAELQTQLGAGETQTQVPVQAPVARSTQTPGYNANTVISGRRWTNPATHRAIPLGAEWQISNQTDADGTLTTTLSNPQHGARLALMLLVANPQEVASMSLDAVGQRALQRAQSNPLLRFYDSGTSSTLAGHPFWQAAGEKQGETPGEPSQECFIQLVEADGKLWSIMGIRPRTDDPLAAAYQRLYADLIGTII
jgi:uncharacterized RDD family membrane protein YckC